MTGKLSPEQLEAMLESLPVEISFVDNEDTVRYFNRFGRRIFPRPESVIGRRVEQCHPQKSLDKVRAIIDGFRKGSLDKAEFWINLKGRLIYIRYIPARDQTGAYLGCLEVSQDVTYIQKLKGEKRLL